MGIKRIVDTAFWTDGKVEEFSPEDRYFMLYLLTNPHSRQLGIYEFSIRRAAYETGYSQETIAVLLERFENKYGIIALSKETDEIAIKNFLRHSIVKGGKPVEDCLLSEMAKVKDKRLIAWVFKHISDRNDLNKSVQKIISVYNANVNENVNDNVNDNENENDVSLPRYVHVSSNTHFSPPTLEEVQKYCKERKNNVNAERFIDYYKARGWFIGSVQMQDWKSAICAWENNGIPNKPTTAKSNPSYDLEAFERMIDSERNPPETAADNPEIRERATALQEAIAQDEQKKRG